jgi:acetolactate synthase-1/2/3 large subunit
MLAVGTRFQWSAASDWRAPVPSELVHVDADPRVIGLNYRPSVPVVGDARLALEGLLDRIGPREIDEAFLRRGQELRVQLQAAFEEQAGPDYREICEGLLRHLPEDAVVAADATMAQSMFGRRMIPATRPRRMTAVATGAIGPGAGTAIGAAVGAGTTTVLIQGDGGFMLSVGELATMAESGAKVVLLVFNDAGYGAIRMLESMSFGERRFATNLNTPDFVTVAGAMGVAGERVEAAAGFEAAFERAVAHDGPYLVDIDLTRMPSTSPVEWRKRAPNGLGGGRR